MDDLKARIADFIRDSDGSLEKRAEMAVMMEAMQKAKRGPDRLRGLPVEGFLELYASMAEQ